MASFTCYAKQSTCHAKLSGRPAVSQTSRRLMSSAIPAKAACATPKGAQSEPTPKDHQACRPSVSQSAETSPTGDRSACRTSNRTNSSSGCRYLLTVHTLQPVPQRQDRRPSPAPKSQTPTQIVSGTQDSDTHKPSNVQPRAHTEPHRTDIRHDGGSRRWSRWWLEAIQRNNSDGRQLNQKVRMTKACNHHRCRNGRIIQ